MREAFEDWRPHKDTQTHLEQIDAVLDEYAGYQVSARQIFYRLVARNFLPNTYSAYLKNNRVVRNGRLAGLIDWDRIEDRTRYCRRTPSWESPRDALATIVAMYRRDWWKAQPFYCEVWVEKDAQVGTIAEPCERWQVPYLSGRGYISTSAMYDAATRRIQPALDARKDVVLFYLGDHDPSGEDMTRDVTDRLRLFLGGDFVDVRRLALNPDQIKRYRPPPQMAKGEDARTAAYTERHGHDRCYELDALPPGVIADLIDGAISELIDRVALKRTHKREASDRKKLAKVTV